MSFNQDFKFSFGWNHKEKKTPYDGIRRIVSGGNPFSPAFSDLINLQKSLDDKVYSLNETEEIERERKVLLEKSFCDFETFELLGKGVFGITYSFTLKDKSLDGKFVVKLYRNPDTQSFKKQKQMLLKDALYIPFHENVASILCHKESQVVDLKILPDYEENWEEDVCFEDSDSDSNHHDQQQRTMPILVMRFYFQSLSIFLEEKSEIFLTTKEISLISEGVVKGVNHLHSNQIVHRDLHTGNIFLDKEIGRVWIGDFGCALDLRNNKNGFKVSVRDEILFSFCDGYSSPNIKVGGYREFLAPEIRKFDSENIPILDYDKSDLYSSGLVIKRVLEYGSWVENNSSENEGKFRRIFGNVVNKMLEKDPQERMEYEMAVKVAEKLKEIVWSGNDFDQFISDFLEID